MAKKKDPLRKPQVSFQVSANFKLAYDLSSTLGGLNHTRLCQAGFLFLLEQPEYRRQALG